MAIDLSDYVDVGERIAKFREKYPSGSLQPVNLEQPFSIQTVGDKIFIVYTAAAYRTPDDARPGIGIASEPFPGKTPYTKDSELMNAETSAWGRAIIASLAADSKRIASAEEVRNRAAEREESPADTSAAQHEDARLAILGAVTPVDLLAVAVRVRDSHALTGKPELLAFGRERMMKFSAGTIANVAITEMCEKAAKWYGSMWLLTDAQKAAILAGLTGKMFDALLLECRAATATALLDKLVSLANTYFSDAQRTVALGAIQARRDELTPSFPGERPMTEAAVA